MRPTKRFTNPETQYGWGAREALSGRALSCAISVMAITAYLSPDLRGQGLCMRVYFTRAEKMKRAEASSLIHPTS
jgi:hypothetical protein